MSNTPRRRLLDRLSATPSLLTRGSRVTGDIETSGPLMINGEVIGDGRIEGELSLAAEAHWQGNLSAHSAVIAGRISGHMLIADKIEIAASAVIRGSVTARRIAMARGATIEGEVRVTGNEPIMQFEERREPGEG
jgi:cytoskeletal protein CcmA (bactofilin family)